MRTGISTRGGRLIGHMDTRNLPRLGDITKRDMQRRSVAITRAGSALSETTLPSSASEMYLLRYPHSLGASIVKKALVPPGTTTDGAWAGPLVGIKPFVDAYRRDRAVRVLTRAHPEFAAWIPFETKVPLQTADPGYTWTKQGDPKPVSKFAFSDGVLLHPTKCTAIVVVTKELISTPDGRGRGACISRCVDLGRESVCGMKSFLDPASTAIPDTRPGSVTSGTTAIAATAHYTADLKALLAAFFTARPKTRSTRC